MKNKKIIVIASLTLLATVAILGLSTTTKSFANTSLYDKVKSAVNGRGITKGPDGVDVTISKVDYIKTAKGVKLKKAEELLGYVPDAELAKKGGSYTRKSLMTYHDFIDLGIADDLRHDIDPERMVWVFTSKFTKDHNFGEKVVPASEVTTVIDGETGDVLSVYNSGTVTKRLNSPDSNSIFFNKQ